MFLLLSSFFSLQYSFMILDVVESIDGVPIRLNEERWYEHILVNHPELSGYLEAVLSAINYPEFICRGYKSSKIAVVNLGRNKWLHVVYKEVSKTDGFIITAYIDKDYHQDSVLWSRHEQE